MTKLILSGVAFRPRLGMTQLAKYTVVDEESDVQVKNNQMLEPEGKDKKN